jgi:hypothetical protein
MGLMTLTTPPAPRIAYDTDGSVVVISRTATNDHNPFIADYPTKASLNTNLATGLAIGSGLWDIQTPAIEYYAKNFVAVVFPHEMDIKAIMVSAHQRTTATSSAAWAKAYVEIQVSTDTTNGQDGSWTTVAYKDEDSYHLPFVFTTATLPPYRIGGAPNDGEYRLNPNDLFKGDGPAGPGWMLISGADEITALRLFFPRRSLPEVTNFSWMLLALNLYGEPSSATGERLELVNADDTDRADLVFGNMDVGTHVTHQIRVKNVSASADATDVRLTGVSAGLPEFYPYSHYSIQLSLDGEAWSPTVRLGDISAGELSPEVFLRVDPVEGMVGLHFARIHAFAGGWS